jgi:hypothetical protein
MPSKPKVFGNHGINGYYFRIANLQRIDVSSDVSPKSRTCDIQIQKVSYDKKVFLPIRIAGVEINGVQIETF